MIFVKTLAGMTYCVNISGDATILDLKKSLLCYLGVPHHQLVIFGGGQESYSDTTTIDQILAKEMTNPFMVRVQC